MEILKEVIGIDVAKDELVVSMGRTMLTLDVEVLGSQAFKNNIKGITKLVEWSHKLKKGEGPLHFVMEATGVYHEALAYYLNDNGYVVSVVLPNKISNFMRTLDIKTVTDYTASQAIMQFGLQRKLTAWQKPDPTLKKLKQLTRERGQLVEERTMLKNQLHAEKSGAEPNIRCIERLMERINLLNKQEKEIKKDIDTYINQNPSIKRELAYSCSIKGIGKLTAVTVLAETNGFELIRNKKQIASYAGFDIKEKLSGTSVKGKPKISKRGNKHIRAAMHLPSLSAVKYIPEMKNLYARLVAKHGIKMKALIAVQRKLLELIYTLHKNQTCYNPEYQKKKELSLRKEQLFAN